MFTALRSPRSSHLGSAATIRLALLLSALGALSVTLGCGEQAPADDVATSDSPVGEETGDEAASETGEDGSEETANADQAGDANAADDDDSDDDDGDAEPNASATLHASAPRDPEEGAKRIFAKRFVVPVRAAPSRSADRIGYLRGGAVVQGMTVEPLPATERCRGGWFELTTGGFVCNVRDVIAFEGRRLPERRARQPERGEPLPYEYAFIRRNAPQYRRPPNDEEAMLYEGWRPPGSAEEPSEGSAMAEAEGTEMSAAEMSAMAEMVAAEMSAMSEPAADMSAMGETASEMSAAAETEEEEEQITLRSLQGESNSVVMRTLMRGFWVSLDRDLRARGRRYWRTQANGFVPYTAVVPRRASDFEGVPLAPPLPAGVAEAVAADDTAADGETPDADEADEADDTDEAPPAADAADLRLPLGWVMDRRPAIYERRDNGRFRRARGRVERREAFSVVETVEDGAITYYRDPTGRWFSSRDVRIVHPATRPEEVGPEDKWLDINLETQSLVAYEGDTPVYATLMSSGKARRPSNPEEDFETLVGLFRVKSKHLTDTMDGDTAVDGPYSVDDVPWVMYFELAYALHGAFWHNGFGYPRSHGCVNLAPRDARWVFEWAGPELPEGWHSVYPTSDNPATWVYVHGDTWGRRE